MPIHITMNDAVTYGAEVLLKGVAEPRKIEILRATKYNLLVKIFNASSLLLLAGTISAIMLSLTSSFVFLAIGLFLRFTSEKEIDRRYALPAQPQANNDGNQQANQNALDRLAGFARRVIGQTEQDTATEVTNIFQNVGMDPQQGWIPDEVTFLDFVVWKNTVNIPEAVQQVNAQ